MNRFSNLYTSFLRRLRWNSASQNPPSDPVLPYAKSGRAYDGENRGLLRPTNDRFDCKGEESHFRMIQGEQHCRGQRYGLWALYMLATRAGWIVRKAYLHHHFISRSGSQLRRGISDLPAAFDVNGMHACLLGFSCRKTNPASTSRFH